MKQFIGVKIVKAEPMTLGVFNKTHGKNIEPAPESGEDGYLVRYPDGYESWCPKKQFEEANRPTDGMCFGHAIEAMRKGHKVAREGWNGKDMYITLIPAGNARHQGFPMQDCVGMKTTQEQMQPGWLASQPDMLADDWSIVG